ncbi:2,3-dihydroxyphenylpropionate/2,3-dihydroxicinnamic acid 1,2-dioxygenase [Sinomonas cellulolyticus]|uniref:3-carboxyethylcatechol 2,3-dioxygenase n=1 Tax=Sinomonas cellulolyticus TaxID=2801916 RepID=A0ABS1K6J0_9MICC|nr:MULTISPECIES: 3-carboxyethylcatechol 2,3-dioxygenase [Sinomonas]MBL0707168.1 3-carboxyethylcatechol 2,3-dioxygenase [Sinomonas cellulolyticus]GHG49844.1 2,3-dihydroxyphenylpropionate/2,3-dihydroxicinnamic acid 1,2-dioxygenase [Sinomonas sp. KCTC 49339]
MTLAVAALSHAPSFGNVDPGGGTFAEIESAIDEVRAFVKAYDPEVVVVFGPDHFNGQLYSLITPWAVGAQAEGVGDYNTTEGPLPVDSAAARALHAHVLEQGIEIGRSERMKVDHGVVQPLDFVFGKDFAQPIVPVFVNSLGMPLTPMRRVREMGEAFGKAAQALDKRVLFVASGGISHNPPIPRWEGAPGTMQERLIAYAPTRQERLERERNIVNGIQAIADGHAPSDPLNEEWDQLLLDTFRSGDLSQVDGWANDWFLAEGGSAAHEMRSWIAAYAALSTAGTYQVAVDHYWPVKTWGAGFGIQAAITVAP